MDGNAGKSGKASCVSWPLSSAGHQLKARETEKKKVEKKKKRDFKLTFYEG